MQAIREERLYVLYFPHLNELEDSKDLLEDPKDNRIMRDFKSQITFFVLKDDGRFDLVAIQTDYKPSN